jgi:uncharacterized membrane protein YbhN (UPF0104 family)
MEASATVDSPPSGGRRWRPAWRRLLVWTVCIVVFVAAANLLGLDIRGWLSDLWHTLTAISLASIVAYFLTKFVQTTATAFAWYSILRVAYPGAVRWRDVLASYAVSVALNSILPANIGTFVLLVMFSVTIAGATFAGVLGSYAVEKIFFTLAGAFVYLYLFLDVGGSFDRKFSFLSDKPVATILLLLGGAFLIYLVIRRLWPHVVRWWEQAKEGGTILVHPRAYFGRVFLPSFVSWLAMLTGIGVLLAAYGIPVTFSTLMHVAGGNSIANVTSVTPGGAGVTQAFNVASLRGVASATDATAYSVANQLLSTAWNILYAICLMIWAWGWTGGKQLVRTSYEDAKRREEEQREKRRRRKAAGQEGVA